MVTEVVQANDEVIPAPSLTVHIYDPNMEARFYAGKAKECLNKSIPMECIEQIGESTETLFDIDPHSQEFKKWRRYLNVIGSWRYFRKETVDMNAIIDQENQGTNLQFSLGNTTSELQVRIHDKNEFINKVNDLKMIELSEISKTVFMKIRRVTKINNCEASPSYSFQQCVENYISEVFYHEFISVFEEKYLKAVGCQLKGFDEEQDIDIPYCNASDFLKYSEMKTNLMTKTNTIFKISKITQCPQNCEVYKYDIVKEQSWSVKLGSKTSKLTITPNPILQPDILEFVIRWLGRELTLEKEVLAYDGLTFVANFGGTLGLFIGFSFFSVWDLILPLVQKCKNLIRWK